MPKKEKMIEIKTLVRDVTEGILLGVYVMIFKKESWRKWFFAIVSIVIVILTILQICSYRTEQAESKAAMQNFQSQILNSQANIEAILSEEKRNRILNETKDACYGEYLAKHDGGIPSEIFHGVKDPSVECINEKLKKHEKGWIYVPEK